MINRARVIFLALFMGVSGLAHAQTVTYLTGLSAASTVASTDTFALCQVGAGCTSLQTLVRGTVGQLATFMWNSPTLVTPNLGTPTAANLTNATHLPLASIDNLGTGVATFLGTPSSANLASALTTKTGTGLAVFDTSPTISGATLSGGPTIAAPTVTGNPTFSGVPTFSGLTAGSQVVCLGLNSLNQLVPNGLPCGSGGSGTPVLFVGSFAGSANTYTMASPTPSGFTLTDQFQVCGKINVTNTGTTTWNINSTGATAVKVQNSSGLQALAGGELIAGTQMCAQYQSSASAFVLQTQVSGHLTVGATSQTISALQWSTGEGFVPAASQTFTLPNSSVTLLSGNGSVGFFAVATTIQASGSDTITSNGATTAGGGSITVPTGSMAIVTGTGISPTNFTVAILYPPVATASVQGLTKLFNVPLSAGWLSGANPDQGIIVSKTQQAMTITAIEGNATALAGGTATIDIYDIASGTASCQGGTKVTTSSFNANTAAGTPQDLLSSPYSLSVGHSLCIRAATWPGSPTSVGTISVYGAPS